MPLTCIILPDYVQLSAEVAFLQVARHTGMTSTGGVAYRPSNRRAYIHVA